MGTWWGLLALIHLGYAAALYTGSSAGCKEPGYKTPDYSQVYTLGSTLPQGCTCKASDVALKECTIFDCMCVCDLTAGQCDYGCCCDTECTDAEIARFREADECLPEGPGAESYTKCWDGDMLSDVNPSFPLSVSSSGQQAIDNLLCVVADNSESKGRFLDDPGFPGSSVFLQSWGKKDYSYVSSASEAASGSATRFSKGDRIPAAFGSGGYSARAAYGGYMPLPAADADGLCNENNYVGFSETTYSSTCQRLVDPSDIASTCTTYFGAKRFTTNMQIASEPDNAASTTSSTSNKFFNVTIANVRYRNPFTLVESSFSSYDCNAWYTTSATSTSGCSVGKSMSGHYASGYCRNAVVSVCYTLKRDTAGRVVSASADLVVTDLLINSTDSVSTVEQSWSVSFTSTAAVTRSSSAGNLVNRTRSGNPGYLFGRPVLAGFQSTSGSSSAITMQYPGLSLAAVTVSGLCTDTMADVTVQFGVDLRAGCSLSLTRGELEDMCSGGGSYISGGIPTFFNVSNTYVGVFGNADPLDVSQWLSLDTSLTSATYLWDDTAGVCYNLITSINYRFLTADVGKSNNPQKKIIAAQVEYGKEDLRFRVEDSYTQSFVFATTVTFIDSELVASAVYTPPPPPVIFSVPYDVFYPFQVYSAATPRRSSSSSWAALWLLLPLLTAGLLVAP